MKVTTTENWVADTTPSVLENIHQRNVNITIYNRDTAALSSEVSSLLKQDIEFRRSGDVDTILQALTKAINQDEFPLIIQDIKDLLQLFREITGAKSFRLFLATVNTNMCRRFHTDINDLRMLCTYSGQGTLWLAEENINRSALNSFADNKSIVLDESKIQRAETGSVLVLKGSVYPQKGANAVVHRSPTIEEDGEQRLLLRIDTDKFINIDS